MTTIKIKHYATDIVKETESEMRGDNLFIKLDGEIRETSNNTGKTFINKTSWYVLK